MARPLVPRFASRSLEQMLGVMPVTIVTGARQTGKSTLARQPAHGDQRQYLTLDDLAVLEQARSAPESLATRASPITIDEVQRAPDLLLAIKRLVDEDRVPGQFLLTGSANPLHMKQVGETLAGRAGYLTLWPLTRREQLGAGRGGRWTDLLAEPASWQDALVSDDAEPEPWQALALRGGYPEPALHLTNDDDRRLWFEAYATTYLERDVLRLSAIDSITDLRRLMAVACLRVGALVNQADLSRDIQLPPTTVQRYLNLLETSFQLVRVPAYSLNRTKRLVKAPKLYWSDPGLALHLAGEHEPRGQHLESLVLSDLLVWSSSRTERTNILHWRTSKGAEVDFVIESGRRVLPIEVKAASRVGPADARHLTTFLDEYADLAPAGLVIYDGTETFWVTERVLAVPWWKAL